MSTHCFIFRIPKGIGLASIAFLSALSVLGMILPTLLFSSSVAFAFSLHHEASSAPPEQVARAGVSVVRLLVSYSTLTAPQSTIQCTGLGAIVASWPLQSSTDQNNWVLTDGTLVNSTGEASCDPAHPKAHLASIKVLLSTAYSPQTEPISLTQTPTVPLTIRCASAGACQNGPVLFAFSTSQTLPFITPAQGTLPALPPTSSAIALLNNAPSTATPQASNSDPNTAQPYATALLQFLVPTSIPSTAAEVGAPIVDEQGHLLGLTLKNLRVPLQAITSFLNHQRELQPPHDNPVQKNWDTGIDAFYHAHNFTAANSAFKAVLATNPQFLGAQTFVQLTATPDSTTLPKGNESGKLNTTAGTSSQGNSLLDRLPIPHSLSSALELGSGVLVAAIILLALITFIRRRARQKRLQEEYAEAERIANTTLEEERRKQQQLWAQQRSQKALSEQPTLTPETAPYAFQQATTDPLPCPNCQKPVQRGTTRCPYCGTSMLLPTDSGFYPRTQLVTPSSASGPFSAPDNQPTIEMSPSMQMSPSTTRNGLTDSDKTRTDPLRQANNQNVGFGVITRTDPGIKRKHKPNEDSLFAAQGTREANSSLQQVGLFVVADGMGGHANGQDASRLAIQTIINYILPKLVQNGEVTGNAFQQLLIDGVQCANQAVHQRNMEQRADMGTTMTAALIVAPIGVTYAEDDTRPPTAVGYIANVGDSRTYLYRQGRGLVKLTNDHSVVASLVEAGIIRPDDIYTHPKRNQIYRSLGEKPAVEVDSFVVALEVDDKLLLCSDGLWDMVRDPQIEEVLKHPVPPNMAGDALIQAALNGGGEDNISVIVVQIPDPNKLNARLGIQLIDKPEAVQMPQL